MGLKVEFPVFVETNLGTRIAIPISQEFTAANLKREVERVHFDIFPELGFLSIHALMVKRNSHLYRLPDSFCLKHACHGFRNFWLLHADASLPKTLVKTSLLGSLVSKKRASVVHVHNGKEVNKKFADIRSKKHKRRRFRCLNTLLLGLVATAYLLRKKRRKTCHLERRVPNLSFPERHDPEKKGYYLQKVHNPAQVSDSPTVAETPCESISEAISVSGIIDRYFADFIEVGHLGSALCSEASLKFGQNLLEGQFGNRTCSSELRDKKKGSLLQTGQTILCSPLSEKLSSVGLRRYERSEVGKRLVSALNSLSRCQNSQGSSLSKGERLQGQDASSVVRNLVFESDDNY